MSNPSEAFLDHDNPIPKEDVEDLSRLTMEELKARQITAYLSVHETEKRARLVWEEILSRPSFPKGE